MFAMMRNPLHSGYDDGVRLRYIALGRKLVRCFWRSPSYRHYFSTRDLEDGMEADGKGVGSPVDEDEEEEDEERDPLLLRPVCS